MCVRVRVCVYNPKRGKRNLYDSAPIDGVYVCVCVCMFVCLSVCLSACLCVCESYADDAEILFKLSLIFKLSLSI